MRRTKENSKKIPNSVITEVIEDYILPMFEGTLNPRNPVIKRNEGLVYSELKLSSQLAREKAALQTELAEYKARYQDFEQQRGAFLTDSETRNRDFLSLQTSLQMLCFQYDLSLKSWHCSEQRLCLKNLYNQKYKRKYEKTLSEKEDLSRALTEQRASNDKTQLQLLQLQQTLRLIVMENNIIGERLMGLYNSFESLSSCRLTQEKLSAEAAHIAHSIQTQDAQLTHFTNKTEELNSQKEFYFEASNELAARKLRAEAKTEQVYHSTQDQLQSLLSEKTALEEENAKLNRQLDEATAKSETLLIEYQNARKLLKHLHPNKVCIHCKTGYTEDANFNWSCRRHRSRFNGTIYFCCGSTVKQVEGCEISKHVARDEAGVELVSSGRSLCSSCKLEGHRPPECPLDPNIRSHFYMNDELERVLKVKELKQREEQSVHQFTLRSRMLFLLHKRESSPHSETSLFTVTENESAV